ncbi:helix-turn-helix domain-containing protein [Terrimonas rubra]|uniref:Helix-turn-helix domain-containing protein n=1 Tax=Terrimonas rubra TaxID=1035890 RepID=A0ABW5ZYY8_9BACT
MKRPETITADFIKILDNHLDKIVSGETDTYLEIGDMAALLHIHPTHLSNTIKATTGKSPCDICNDKTIERAQKLLQDRSLTIASIAMLLTYEPTNFTKYFKKHTGQTPLQYRNSL